MNLNLSGKRALVCGSTQGIGLAAATELAAMGANIVLLARNKEKLNEAKNTLAATGEQKHFVIAADFANPDEVISRVENFIGENGIIDILINNTGGPPAGNIEIATAESFRQAFESHLICNHLLAQTCIAGMKQNKYGRIINVISTSVKQPLKGLGVSNTIRAAVGNWSKTLANEVAAYGITVNNVLPGATLTSRLKQIIHDKAEKTGHSEEEISKEMVAEIPMKRFGQPEEIAAAIAFLASPAAAYINGTNMVVDGGRTGCL